MVGQGNFSLKLNDCRHTVEVAFQRIEFGQVRVDVHQNGEAHRFARLSLRLFRQWIPILKSINSVFLNTVCFIRSVQITLWQDQKRNIGRGKWMFAKRFFSRHFIIQTYSYILCFHLNIDGTFTSFKSSQFVSPGIGCWSKALLLSYSWFWKTTFVNWDSSKILSASWNEVTMKWGRVE